MQMKEKVPNARKSLEARKDMYARLVEKLKSFGMVELVYREIKMFYFASQMIVNKDSFSMHGWNICILRGRETRIKASAMLLLWMTLHNQERMFVWKLNILGH